MSYLSRTEALERIQSGEWNTLPLDIAVREGTGRVGKYQCDWLMELQWEDVKEQFMVEFKRRSTPKILQEAVQSVKRIREEAEEVNPMVMVPYLDEEKLDYLEAENVSGLDLCGNGVIIVPGRMYVRESGNPNQFPDTSSIKNVFGGKSSFVVRTLLSVPSFPSVNAVVQAIEERGGSVSQSTVSRVLQRLEELLLIDKKRGDVQVKDLEELLEQLEKNFEPPQVQSRKKGTLEGTENPLQGLYQSLEDTEELMAGVSVDRYTILTETDQATPVYVTSIDTALQRLKAEGFTFKETEAFPEVMLQETRNEEVYFDTRILEDVPWCSPVQMYLELNRGDQRQQEAAEQIRKLILEQGTQHVEGV